MSRRGASPSSPPGPRRGRAGSATAPPASAPPSTCRASYLASRAGFEAQHVSFRGGAQTITAMLSGDIQYAVDNLATYVGVIQEGRMRALAVTLPERWPALPDVPTMAEAGLAGFRGLALASVGGAARHAAGDRRPALGRDPRRLGRPGAAAARDRHGRAADRLDARGAGGAAGQGEADLGGDGEGQRRAAGIVARDGDRPGASAGARGRPEAPAPRDRPPDAQADPAPAVLLAVLGLGACDDKPKDPPPRRRRAAAPRPPRRAAPRRNSSAPGCA